MIQDLIRFRRFLLRMVYKMVYNLMYVFFKDLVYENNIDDVDNNLTF